MIRRTFWKTLTLVFAVPVAAMAVEIGTVANAKDAAEIGRDGAWFAAAPGTPLRQGDRLRTGNPGQLRVVFQDDTVLTLNDDTEIVLDESVFQPERGTVRSLMQLLRGAINAVVGEYYDRPGSEYTVKTATATAGVRGTEFVVAYFPELGLSEVIGISGKVAVRSMDDGIDDTVWVTAEEVTHVVAGEPPTPPQPFGGADLERRLERFDIVGSTRIESLAAWQGGVQAAGARTSGIERFSAHQERIRRAQDASNLLSDSPAGMTRRQLGVRF